MFVRTRSATVNTNNEIEYYHLGITEDELYAATDPIDVGGGSPIYLQCGNS